MKGTDEDQAEHLKQQPDVKMIITKQRLTGVEETIYLWFDPHPLSTWSAKGTSLASGLNFPESPNNKPIRRPHEALLEGSSAGSPGVHDDSDGGLRPARGRETSGLKGGSSSDARKTGVPHAGPDRNREEGLQCVPISEPWRSFQVLTALRNMTGSTPDVRIVQGCLRDLVDSGLIRRTGTDHQRIQVEKRPSLRSRRWASPLRRSKTSPSRSALPPAGDAGRTGKRARRHGRAHEAPV